MTILVCLRKPFGWAGDQYGQFREFVTRNRTNFGSKFVTLLFTVYFFNKGIAHKFLYAFQLPFYRSEYKVDSIVYQSYKMIGSAPWSMKGFIGVMSDSWPLFGLHKTSWMLLASIAGSGACLALILFPFTASTIYLAPMFIFFISIQIATNDLLCEGKYAEMMGEKPETKGDAVSLVWGLIMVGGLLGNGAAGYMTDHVHPVKYTLIVALVALVVAVFPILKGYMPEEKIARGGRGIKWDKIKQRYRMFALATFMAVGGLGLVAIILTGTNVPGDWDLYQLIYSLTISCILCTAGFWALPKTLAMCNLYMFLQEVLYIQLPGSLDYWYTAGPECVPGGPHFSYTYYIFWVGTVASIAGIFGVIVFQRCMSTWTFRQCFWITTAVRTIGALFDVIIIERANIKIGIPDWAMYMFGDGIIFTIVEMLAFMPGVVLTSKLCPKEMEATVYALLAGFQNFGQAVSQSIGIYLQAAFNVRLSDTECTYENLTKVVLFAHFFLPLIAIPLTFVLIPNARLDDDLLALLKAEEKGGGLENTPALLGGSNGQRKETATELTRVSFSRDQEGEQTGGYDMNPVEVEISPRGRKDDHVGTTGDYKRVEREDDL